MDRIERSIMAIRGYCRKMVDCDMCRYVDEKGNCPFNVKMPADWKTLKERVAEGEKHGMD